MAKTKGVKNCTAGNVKCGNRCIPQSWDCRLRGEGQDKQLKASQGLDPLGTLAQVQRGGTRILKGVQKANFSEIEGGRRQLIRTVSRNSSGKEGKPLTLKEKKEIADRLIAGTAALGTVAAVLAGGYAAHRTLMRAPSYRARVGNGINNAVNDAQNRLLDSVPLSGGKRAKNAAGAVAAGERSLRITAPNAESNRALVLGTTAQPPSGPTSELNKKLSAQKFAANATAAQVEAESLRTYLTAKQGGKNIHAEAAAMETLATSYGLDLRKTGRMDDVRRELLVGVTKSVGAEKAALRSDMQQRGFAVTNKDDQSLYIEQVFGGDAVKEDRVRTLLNTTESKVAKDTLAQLTTDWGDFYESMADSIGTDITRMSSGRAVSADTNDVLQIARVKHAEYLDRNMLTNAGGRINRLGGASTQTASMQLTALEFHARKNGSRVEWTASKALVGKAAKEQGISTDNFNDTFMEMSKKFVGLRGEVQFPTGVSRPAKDLLTKKGFSDQEAILNIYKRLRRERKTKVSAVELMRQAVAEHERGKKRKDSEDRNDFTPSGDRAGKPCGKSFIPKSQKCAKPTTARYAEKPKPEPKKGGGETASTLAKVGLATGGLVLGAAAAKKGLKSGINRIKSSKSSAWYVKNAQKTIGQVEQRKAFYDKLRSPQAKMKYIGTSIQKGVAETRQQMTQLGSHATIKALSNENVNKGLAQLPEEWQDDALKMVGNAKRAAAQMSLEASGYKPVEFNLENNFSRWRGKDGSMKSIGSVGDSLVSFNVGRTRGQSRSVDVDDRETYNVDFLIDNDFNQKQNLTPEEGKSIGKMITTMFSSNTKDLKDGSLLFNSPWKQDTKGDARAAVYKRYNFNDVPEVEDLQWAEIQGGKTKRQRGEAAENAWYEIAFPEEFMDDEVFDSAERRSRRVRWFINPKTGEVEMRRAKR